MKVEKIADNHWKITKTKKIKDIKGKEFEIDDEPVEIGTEGIQQQIDIKSGLISFWSNKANIDKQLADWQTEKEEYEAMLLLTEE